MKKIYPQYSTVGIRLLILCFCVVSGVFGQENERAKLLAQLKPTKDSTEIYLLNKIAITFYPQEIDSAIVYMQKAKNIAYILNRKSDLAGIYKKMGVFYYYDNDYDNAIEYYGKAINTYKQLEPAADFAEAYRGLGICYYEKGEYTNSIKQYHKAIQIFETVEDSVGIGRTLNSIGSSLETLGDTESALSFYKRSVKIKENIKDSSGISVGMMNLGNVFTKLGKFDRAMTSYEKALSIANSLNDTRLIVDAYTCQAGSSHELGRYDLAEDTWMKALGKFSNYRNDYQKSDIYNGLAATLIELGRANEAMEYLKKNIDISTRIGAKVELKRSYQNMSEAYVSLGDYQSAYESIQQYAALKDSLYNKENLVAVHEMRVKYEKERDEREIAALKHQNEIEKLNSEKQNTLNYIFITALVAVSMLVLALIMVVRQRRKVNQLLGASLKEKNVLLKEIHHRVKNNFQLISSLLNLQSNMIEDETAIAAIDESKNRVISMALVHQHIYQAENLSSIRMHEYIEELMTMIARSMQKTGQEIETHIDAEEIMFDVEVAIPIGLILNELITNSFKYAFEGRKSGNVTIEFNKIGQDKFLLHFYDDGIGLPKDFDLENLESLGLLLVQLLVAQIKGNVKVKNGEGTHFYIDFTYDDKSDTSVAL